MSAEPRFIPAGSQTVGPYFRIGLQYLIDRASEVPQANGIFLQGRVLDRDGAPVPDAMLEFWSATVDRTSPADALPHGFRRVGTDLDGAFSVAIPKPGAAAIDDELRQAPHWLVLVFARGLLRHLITRVYFDDEPANASDPVLLSVPAERRNTLIARRDRNDSYRWDVILQGSNETVFFAW